MMDVSLFPPLDAIIEEVSLDECCSAISDQNAPISQRISLLLTLATKFQETTELSTDHADNIISNFPSDLLDACFQTPGYELLPYQKLMFVILSRLVNTCSDEVWKRRQDIVHVLLKFLSWSNRSKEELNGIRMLVRDGIDEKLRNRCLDVVVNVLDKENQKELWDLDLLKFIVILLEFDVSGDSEDRNTVKRLVKIVSDIVRCSPHRIPSEYKVIAFHVISGLCENFGPEIFVENESLLCLVAHLASGELRIILDRPENINTNELVVSLNILEIAIRCVDDETFLNDDDALKVSKAVQAAGAFVLEYWAAAKKSENKPSVEVERCFFRFLCLFLSIGGAQLLEPRYLKDVLPYARELCESYIETEEFGPVSQFLGILDQFPTLDISISHMFIRILTVLSSKPDSRQVDQEVASVLDVLQSRSDWYDTGSIRQLKLLAKDFPQTAAVLQLL